MNNNKDIQNNFVVDKKNHRKYTSIYLVNGIKLKGVIEAYDSQVIFLKSSKTQMVYKHAIATIE